MNPYQIARNMKDTALKTASLHEKLFGKKPGSSKPLSPDISIQAFQQYNKCIEQEEKAVSNLSNEQIMVLETIMYLGRDNRQKHISEKTFNTEYQYVSGTKEERDVRTYRMFSKQPYHVYIRKGIEKLFPDTL